MNVESEEKWLVHSGSMVHVTNLEQYMVNKTKDRSTIVVGTGKETKALARGDIIINYTNTNHLIEYKNVLLVLDFKQIL